MDGAMIIVPVEGEPTHVGYEAGQRPSLGDIQQAVGGSIELIPLLDRVDMPDGDIVEIVAYCNEEGKINRLPVNVEANLVYTRSCLLQGLMPDDILVGPVVLLMGTKEFLGRGE